jgi:hypothetical protein
MPYEIDLLELLGHLRLSQGRGSHETMQYKTGFVNISAFMP